MADDSDEDGPGIASTRPASSVPREKPLIEGVAQEVAAGDAQSEVPEEDPWAALPGPATAEVMPSEPPPEDVAADSSGRPNPPRDAPNGRNAPGEHDTRGPRLSAWPFAAALVAAALLAIAGAFGLHMLDRTPAHLAALESLVGTLQNRTDAAQGLAAAEKDLAARVAALEQANRDIQTELASLRAELGKLGAQKPQSSALPDLAPLTARLGTLEQKLAALGTQVGGLAETLNAEKGQVRATETRVSASAAANAGSEAIAILAANLLRKVDAGAPYDADLNALANRGLDRAKLAPLDAAAATGVATPAALAKQFSDLVPAILATEPQPKENGFLDHLVKGAEGLVHVEKIGAPSGSDLADRLAGIEAALSAGNVEAAYQQWTGLPAAAKAKSADFGTAAKTRLDTLAAARSLDSEAVAALGKAKS